MTKHAAHTQVWKTGETVFGLAILFCLILGYVFPLPFPALVPRALSVSVGILLLLISIVIIIKTRRQFNQAGQPTDPGQPTTELITTGLFSWSRNPLYLGAVIFFIGLGGLFNTLWFYILLIPAIIAAQTILIVPEENYLEAKFGGLYLQYTRSVRRWFGRYRQ